MLPLVLQPLSLAHFEIRTTCMYLDLLEVMALLIVIRREIIIDSVMGNACIEIGRKLNLKT